MATSGTFTGDRGGNQYGPWLIMDWSRIDVDIPNNRSLIRLTLKLASDRNIQFSASKNGVLDGTSFTYTGNFYGPETRTIKTKDVWVNHNSDGSRTEAFSATFDINITWSGSWLSRLYVSGSAVIDTIPRASDFTAFTLSNTSLNTSTATTINYTLSRKSSSFDHDMTLKYGSKVIATWSATTGALTRTLSATEVNSILSAMSTVTSGTLTLTMQTMSGSTKIGSSKTINEGISINAAVKPSASGLSTSISGTGRDKTLNMYIQTMSKVVASFTRSAGYGASISSSTISVKHSSGANSQIIGSNSGTVANALTHSGTYNIVGTVKDSRGRTATVSGTITVQAYSPPSLIKFTGIRSNPTTTVSLGIDAIWSQIGTSNPATIKITGTTSATSVVLFNKTNDTSGRLTATQLYTGQSDAYSYTYTISVTDSFGANDQAQIKVGTTFVEFTIAKGKGIGVGKVHERGSVDVSGDVYIAGKLNVNALVMNDGTVSKETITAITGDANGIGLSIGAGGLLALGAGESADTMIAGLGWSGGAEQLLLTSDSNVYVTTNLQGGFAGRYSWTFTPAGNLTFPNANSIYLNQYGNVVSPGNVPTSATWGVYDSSGAEIIRVPIHSSQNSEGATSGIFIGQHQIYSNRGPAGDPTAQSIYVYRMYTSGNREFVVVDDATNGWYFNADQGLPGYGGVGTGNGNLYAAKYNVVSDKEQKDEIKPYSESALDQIRPVKTHTYKHKESESKRNRNRARGIERQPALGLIAQDAPSTITTETGLGIDLYAMSTLLWKGMQELADQVDFLNGQLKKRG